MKIRLFLPLVLLLIAAQTSPPLAITSPKAEEVLRGQEPIRGTLDVANYISARLEFAYASNPTDTWFTIQTVSGPVVDARLAVWDTTLISDGSYLLRLRVEYGDNTFQEVTVPVTVGNDLLPTPTPLPATPTQEELPVLVPTPFLLAASPTPTELPRATPTPLPPNPASLARQEIYDSLRRGALVILGLFALAGVILRLRRP